MQRVITDFGADVPFGRIPEQLKEHYGVRVPVSSAQMITEHHAALMLLPQEIQSQIPHKPGVDKLMPPMTPSLG